MNPRSGPFHPAFQRNLEDMKTFIDQLEREKEAFLNGLLPVLDKVDQICRGIDGKTPDQLADCARMLALLPDIVDAAAASIGLDRFAKVGEQVDPLRHEIRQIQRSDQPNGTILEIFECGWEFDGRILRRALVSVSDKCDPPLEAEV